MKAACTCAAGTTAPRADLLRELHDRSLLVRANRKKVSGAGRRVQVSSSGCSRMSRSILCFRNSLSEGATCLVSGQRAKDVRLNGTFLPQGHPLSDWPSAKTGDAIDCRDKDGPSTVGFFLQGRRHETALLRRGQQG